MKPPMLAAMLKNIRASMDRIRRETARNYLYDSARKNLGRFPQMACYSFDFIGIEINVDGRFDHAQLTYLDRLLAPRMVGKTVLDVGANIGNHARAFAASACKVLSFEPHPRTFQLLRLNTMDTPNIEIFEMGASDEVDALPAVSPKLNFGASTITDRPVGEGEFGWTCNVAPLDDLATPDWGEIAVMKIDVEGHEPQAIRGASKLLARHRPIILLEQNQDSIADGTSESLDLLRGLGYRHFSSLEVRSSWRTPQALPGVLRKALRIGEGALFGPPAEESVLVPVDRLEPRSYATLIASFDPIQ